MEEFDTVVVDSGQGGEVIRGFQRLTNFDLNASPPSH